MLRTVSVFSFVEPPEILPFNFGKEIIDEGDYAHVSCVVTKGDIPLTIRWTLHGGEDSIGTGACTLVQPQIKRGPSPTRPS